MYKKFIKNFTMLLTVSAGTLQISSAQAQTEPLVQKGMNIPPLEKEFGPHAWQPNSITDRTPFLGATLVHTDGKNLDGTPNLEVRGAFRFVCEAGQLKADDPVVAYGKPGRSHVHDFYGSATIDAYSTYESNRLNVPVNPLDRTSYKTVGTTCQNALNLSGYWNPAMYNGDPTLPGTKVVRPEYITVYYKRFPKNGQHCDVNSVFYVGRCVATPHAIAYVFGYDMITNTPPTGGYEWWCLNGGISGPKFDNMVDAFAGCPDKNNLKPDAVIHVQTMAPECWDGKNTRSANNRSHVSYMMRDAQTGRSHCPQSHPYAMPAFELGVFWSIYNDPTIDMSGVWAPGKKTGWRLASDSMPGMVDKKPGLTWHADYFEGWDEKTKKAWTDNCIDRYLNCSAGDLGDGTALNDLYGLDFHANRRLANRPKMANEESHAELHGPQ